MAAGAAEGDEAFGALPDGGLSRRVVADGEAVDQAARYVVRHRPAEERERHGVTGRIVRSAMRQLAAVAAGLIMRA